MNNKKNTLQIVVGSLLVLLLIGVTVLLISEKRTNNELVQEFNLEKEDLENQYTDFAKQYDELKLTVSNDSLSVLLEQEQLKTQRLLEELRTVKSTNATEIRRLKKELATLRKVMIGYINQIDSLSRLTNHQKEVIADVTRKYNVASQQISNLSEEKKNLNKKVTLAAQLDATNINIQATNKRGKKAKKVKDVVKLKINLTIVKNITAETGERTLYVRITKPDNDVLSKNASNTFPYENRELAYSIKKYIEYNGEEQSVTVYWDVEEFLYAGSYRVDIFSDGTLIGSQSFNLD
jgi:chromosome segregation ATPase